MSADSHKASQRSDDSRESLESTAHVHWLSDSSIAQTGCPVSLRPWLLDRDSLTKRLVNLSDDNFHVDVYRQQHVRPLLSEAQLLDAPHHQQAFVREVVLKGHGDAWVFGRTVIPLQTLTGRLRALRNLEGRPLGALLFAEPSMTRGPVEVTKVPSNNPLVPAELFTGRKSIWGRRSLFYIDQKPLLVNEVFLPAFTDFIAAGKGRLSP